jgi:hypothetical protein
MDAPDGSGRPEPPGQRTYHHDRANHQDPVTTFHLPHSNPGHVDRMVKENHMTLAEFAGNAPPGRVTS